MRTTLAAVCAGLLLAVLPAGCGREVNPPSLEGAKKALEQAEVAQAQGQLQNAEQFYRAAFNSAEGAMRLLVPDPGNKLLPEAERIRNKAAEQIGRIREELRKLEVTGAPQVASGPKNQTVKNLLPPVAPYAAAAPEKTPGTPAPTTPPTGTPPATTPPETPKPPAGEQPTTPPATTEPPKPDPGPADAPKPEPAGPKAVRITKAVVKDNKAVVIHWTLTNLSADKNLTAGAPAGKALNKRGGTVASAFQTFLAEGFQYNAADPGASAGTRHVADGSNVAPGKSRNFITVVVVSEAQAGLIGGAKVELRMSEGEDLTDKVMEVSTE